MIKNNIDDEVQYGKVYGLIAAQMQWFQDRLELSIKMEQEVGNHKRDLRLARGSWKIRHSLGLHSEV
jgi:hypothetical protein